MHPKRTQLRLAGATNNEQIKPDQPTTPQPKATKPLAGLCPLKTTADKIG